MRTELSALRLSLVAILVFSALGIGFGIVSGSSAIIFDGVFSLVDAAISVVSITVAGLIARSVTPLRLKESTTRRFASGFWHFEPMVVAISGVAMISVATYALVQSLLALFSGGRDIEFGPAVAYAAIVLTLSTAVGLLEHRANRRIGSSLVAMDVKGWIMTGGVTAALLIAFVIGLLLQGTSLAWLMPYIDPAVLTLIALVLIPVPLPELRRAIGQIGLVTPPLLQREAEAVAAATVAEHSFAGSRVWAMEQGRSRQFEITFLVPPARGTQPLEAWDAIRDGVEQALVGENPHHTVTISFTTRGVPRAEAT